MNKPATNTHFAPRGEIEHAFIRAGQIWDTRQGLIARRARDWMLLSFALVFTQILCIVGMIFLATRPAVVPYLVEVESSGQVRLVGRPTEQEWSLKDSSKREVLTVWIRNLRSLSSDRRVLTERYAHVRTRSTSSTNLKLDHYFQKHDPWAAFGEEVRTVHTESFVTIAGSENAYRVTWREEVFDPNGSALYTRHYIGEFHLSIVRPRDEEALKANPLGVYVSFFDFDEKQ